MSSREVTAQHSDPIRVKLDKVIGIRLSCGTSGLLPTAGCEQEEVK